MMILAYFRVMYTVGYCVSLASLCLALIILVFFRYTYTSTICLLILDFPISLTQYFSLFLIVCVLFSYSKAICNFLHKECNCI